MKLGPQILLSTDPRDKILHCKQCVFPTLEPIQITEEDKVLIEVVTHVIKDHVQFDWETSFIRKGDRHVFAHHYQSTDKFDNMSIS